MQMVYCTKLHKEAEGLDFPPFKGELGEKIYKNISKEAWEMWMTYQTRLINEYRLSMNDQKSKEIVLKEMEEFLFS